jgi:hypothetical protein
LTLAIDEIATGDSASLLTVSYSQVKSTDALLANIILQTHVTILNFTGVGNTLIGSIRKVSRKTIGTD